MRLTSFLCVASVVLTPAQTHAQSTPEQEAIIRGMLLFDCVMTRQTEDAVLLATGLTEDEAEVAAAEMMAAGLFDISDERLILLHPECPAQDSALDGVEVAIDWMERLRGADAANAVAEIAPRSGCGISGSAYSDFTREFIGAVETRFGFDLTEQDAETIDRAIEAFERLHAQAVLALVRDGRIEEGADAMEVIGCEAG